MPTDQDTVLITGCSSGIGRATARLFREEGWRVYATARDTDDIADLAAIGCETAALDVTDGRAIRDVVERIIEEAGRIDCLVNNAGYAQYGAVEDVPVRDLARQFDVNVYGPHRLIRAVLPHMREAGDGTIVNVSSGAGRTVHPLGGVYSASKYALEALSDALRPEVAGQGIDVVLVEPGPVDSDFIDRAANETNDLQRTPAYDGFYRFYDDVIALGGAGPLSVDPEAVAVVIVDAGRSLNPSPRYPVGTVARVWMATRFLPDRLRDLVFRLAAYLPG